MVCVDFVTSNQMSFKFYAMSVTWRHMDYMKCHMISLGYVVGFYNISKKKKKTM